MTTIYVQQAHPSALISPTWYALGSLVAVPLIAVVLIFGVVFLLVMWPFTPFVCYVQRKKELAAQNNSDTRAPT